MKGLATDKVFIALTRPQIFAGVTYNFFVANAIVTTELFLIFHSTLALISALILHLVGVLMCLREPRFLELWIARVGHCPRVKNHALWQCNSYRP